MVEAARSVLQRLEETRALSDAFLSRNGYGLVITGKCICSSNTVAILCTPGGTLYTLSYMENITGWCSIYVLGFLQNVR